MSVVHLMKAYAEAAEADARDIASNFYGELEYGVEGWRLVQLGWLLQTRRLLPQLALLVQHG